MRYFGIRHTADPVFVYIETDDPVDDPMTDFFYAEDEMRAHPSLSDALDRWEAGDKLAEADYLARYLIHGLWDDGLAGSQWETGFVDFDGEPFSLTQEYADRSEACKVADELNSALRKIGPTVAAAKVAYPIADWADVPEPRSQGGVAHAV